MRSTRVPCVVCVFFQTKCPLNPVVCGSRVVYGLLGTLTLPLFLFFFSPIGFFPGLVDAACPVLSQGAGKTARALRLVSKTSQKKRAC